MYQKQSFSNGSCVMAKMGSQYWSLLYCFERNKEMSVQPLGRDPSRLVSSLTGMDLTKQVIILQTTESKQVKQVSVLCFRQLISSVTRFGEISPCWPKFKSLGHFFRVYLGITKMLNRLWEIQYAFGKISIVVNGPIMNK